MTSESQPASVPSSQVGAEYSGRPSWGTRVRVWGYLLLWLLEGMVQFLWFGVYLVRRHAVRSRFRELICDPEAAPHRGS